jgi:hypothetical protein
MSLRKKFDTTAFNPSAMSRQLKTKQGAYAAAGFGGSSRGLEEIRDRLICAMERGPSDGALQRLIELAARCVSESAAWDAFADAQDVNAAASWEEVQRLEREAQAAKQARILAVDRLRDELDD